MARRVNKTIGGYHLDGKIAVGGSGTVYRATRTSDGSAVAFKLMHSGLDEHDAEKQRFSREAQIVQTLVHPHVVRLLDYGHSDRGVPFLVFPLLAGVTLDKRLKKGPLDVRQTGRLSLQILSALERAHQMDIAHRDIKPANIFLAGEPMHALVLDFGLAKLLNAPVADITRVGALIGTPRYMAPEQVRGERVGMAGDIYSFGLVMAEMLTSAPLVTAKGELDIYMAHGSDRALDIPPKVLASPFASVIRRAVAKPLEVRYQKASQMHADVQAIMSILERDGDAAPLASADMESTFVVSHEEIARRSNLKPSQLREVLNQLADKADAHDIPDAAPTLIPDAAPTLPYAVPEAIESLPILLTRESEPPDDPEAETARIKKKKR